MWGTGLTPGFSEAADISLGQSTSLSVSVSSSVIKGKITEPPWLDCVKFKQGDSCKALGPRQDAWEELTRG